jgi:hypothetical protein
MSPFGKLRATLDAERLASNNCADYWIDQCQNANDNHQTALRDTKTSAA